MADKYHINPETGRPNKCSATIRGCKFAVGNEIPEHYDSKEEARKGYEKKMEADNNNIFSSKKKKVVLEDITNPITVKKFKTPLGNVLEGHYKNVGELDYDTVEKSMKEIDEKAITGYSSCISNLETDNIYNDSHETGYVLNEGQYYYPTPDEPYHGSDIAYTSEPYIKIINDKKFVKALLKDTKIDVDDDLVNSLNKGGLLHSDVYEAKITGGYYGDEFHGFTMSTENKNNFLEIVAIHQLLRDNEKFSDE